MLPVATPAPAPGSEHQGPLMALTMAGDALSARLRKGLGLYVMSAGAVTISRQWWERARSTMTFVVSVDAEDVIYPQLHRWVLDRVPRDRLRSLVVRTARADDDQPVLAGGGAPAQRVLRLFYDGRRAQTVTIGSHRVRVTVETEDLGAPNLGATDSQSPSRGGWRLRRDRVVFTAYGAAARDSVLEVLEALANEYNARRTAQLFMPRWSDWSRVEGMGLRPLESVVLRAGQKESLVNDLAEFLAAEEDYTRLGVPWHRGFLFKGPPGTGKTSLAKALAAHFRLDVHYMPLTAVHDDEAFLKLLSAVPPRSMLLIEDVDIAHGARKRDDSEPGVSMSGLLNGLDGITTPHGMVSVLTTNKDEVIDPALLRSGRIDRQEFLDYVDEDQLERLVRYLAGSTSFSAARMLGNAVTPSDVVEVFKRHLGQPADEAIDDLVEMLRGAPPAA